MVLSLQAYLAPQPDFHLPALANQRRSLVAIPISGGANSVAPRPVEIETAPARSAGSDSCFSRNAFPSVGFHKRLSVHLLVCRRSLPVSRLHWPAYVTWRRNYDRGRFLHSEAGYFSTWSICPSLAHSWDTDLASKPAVHRHRDALADNDRSRSQLLDGAQQFGIVLVGAKGCGRCHHPFREGVAASPD